jgi:hypothetical protein
MVMTCAAAAAAYKSATRLRTLAAQAAIRPKPSLRLMIADGCEVGRAHWGRVARIMEASHEHKQQDCLKDSPVSLKNQIGAGNPEKMGSGRNRSGRRVCEWAWLKLAIPDAGCEDQLRFF